MVQAVAEHERRKPVRKPFPKDLPRVDVEIVPPEVPAEGVERYIADFFAPSVGLVIEVDGGAHRKRRMADRRRDAKLRCLGYRVVRIEASLALRNISAALELVRKAL